VVSRRGNDLTFRSNFDELADSLTALGADHVLTYDSLNDKSIKDKVKSWTGGQVFDLIISNLQTLMPILVNSTRA
jgi:NADPH:quinone reductase-like Zn-dependent oxidoreductase